MGLDKCVMTSIHHYRVIQCIFTALKIHYATPVHPPTTPYLLETSDLFIVFIVLSFPECHMDFPGGSDGKDPTCNLGDLGPIPELGSSPGGGHGNPLQYSCLQNTHGQRSLVGYSR